MKYSLKRKQNGLSQVIVSGYAAIQYTYPCHIPLKNNNGLNICISSLSSSFLANRIMAPHSSSFLANRIMTPHKCDHIS